MKKHIIGLAIFSFIVISAVIAYAIFNVPETVTVYKVVSTPKFVTTETTHCKMKMRGEQFLPQIRQVVYNLPTKQFSWELEFPVSDEPIDLLFFSKDNQGTRFITGERINNSVASGGTWRISRSYDWISNLKSFENLYVIAQYASESKNYSKNYEVNGNKFQPKFDAMRATAVTIDYGE